MKSETSVWKRKFIHVDMDAFFAAIEERDNPKLAGKPVVVGGDPFGRGVVSTCSYEARKYGIRSAMACAQARKLCPQAIFVRPHFEKYQKESHMIRQIFRQHTDLVEPLSLDEAYLDVTRHRLGMEDPVLIAKMIKQNIHAVTKLTASAGVAPLLYLAKIASDYQKPDGLTVVYPGQVLNFLKDLPVRKIPGVGPVTEKHLHALGIQTCGDLAGFGCLKLQREFGKTGLFLYERASGIDESEVEPNVPSKQLSMEETFEKDTADVLQLSGYLKSYAEEIYQELRREGRMGRTVVLKVKYHDFESITRSQTLKEFPRSAVPIYETAAKLLKEKTLAGKKLIRLIGLGVSGLEEVKAAAKEKTLFDL